MLAVGWPDFSICMMIRILSRNHLWGQRFRDNIHCNFVAPVCIVCFSVNQLQQVEA